MGNKRDKKQTPRQPSTNHSGGEYNLKDNFSKVKKYQGKNFTPTESNFRDTWSYGSNKIDNTSSQITQEETLTSITRGDFYNLDGKISSLTSANHAEHDSLRKDYENKIKDLKTDINSDIEKLDSKIEKLDSKIEASNTKTKESRKNTRKWMIDSILVPLIVAMVPTIISGIINDNKIKRTVEDLTTTTPTTSRQEEKEDYVEIEVVEKDNKLSEKNK